MVDGDRLSRAGGAGDEQVRHAGKVDDDALAADRLAERDGEPVLGPDEVLGGDELAQVDGLAPLVGQLDADGVAALDHRDAGRHGRHGAGDVVGEADDTRRLDARRRLEFVERHHGAGTHVDDLAADAEVLEHALEQPRVLAERIFRHDLGRQTFGFGQDGGRRQVVVAGSRGSAAPDSGRRRGRCHAGQDRHGLDTAGDGTTLDQPLGDGAVGHVEGGLATAALVARTRRGVERGLDPRTGSGGEGTIGEGVFGAPAQP